MDLAEAVRRPSAAEQLAAARVVGHGHAQSCRAHCTSVAPSLRAALRGTRQCYRDRPRTSRRPRVSGGAGCTRSIATSCKRKPFGGCNLDQIAAITMVTQRRWRSRRKPAAACGRCSSRVHRTRTMQLAGSPAIVNRPAEAARCLEVTCEHLGARSR